MCPTELKVYIYIYIYFFFFLHSNPCFPHERFIFSVNNSLIHGFNKFCIAYLFCAGGLELYNIQLKMHSKLFNQLLWGVWKQAKWEVAWLPIQGKAHKGLTPQFLSFITLYTRPIFFQPYMPTWRTKDGKVDSDRSQKWGEVSGEKESQGILNTGMKDDFPESSEENKSGADEIQKTEEW